MGTEKLKFKLELYATMWDKPPHAEILINDKSHFTGDITGTEDKPDVVEFEREFTEGEKCDFVINRTNKLPGQTIVEGSNNKILKDQSLHIKAIEVDEIDIGALVYEGVYSPEYPEPWASQQRQAGVEVPESFKNATQLGHNGKWRFTFKSPFYIWLLENLY
jgi:hypothetical protein